MTQLVENGNSSLAMNGRKQSRFPVIFFGRLEERKGLCTFVEAIKQLEPALRSRLSITFLGKIVPLYSSELRHLDSQQYLEQELGNLVPFRIVSNLSSKEAIALVKNLDNPIVCLTSPQENFPNSALEMGQLPVRLVVADTGGFHETLKLVNRSSALYWFKPKDCYSLAETLRQVLTAANTIVPEVVGEAALLQINRELLVQKTNWINQAFSSAQSKPDVPTVTIGVVCNGKSEYLIEALTSLEQQTYQNLEVLVLNSSLDEVDQDRFEQAQLMFPRFRFITTDTHLSFGAACNRLVELSGGSYFLPLSADSVLLPFAIEKFVAAASQSKTAITLCARKEFGSVDRVVSFVEGTLPSLMRANLCQPLCALFAVDYLHQFRFSETLGVTSQAWELLAAAIVTDAKITYFPYPLYEHRVASDQIDRPEAIAKAQYHLRQYLAKIPAAAWSARQLYMLLTATQQLGTANAFGDQNTSAMAAQLQQCQRELAQTQARLKETQGKLKRARNRAKETQTQLEQANQRIEAMETSKFWRIRKGWFRFKKALRLSSDE